MKSRRLAIVALSLAGFLGALLVVVETIGLLSTTDGNSRACVVQRKVQLDSDQTVLWNSKNHLVSFNSDSAQVALWSIGSGDQLLLEKKNEKDLHCSEKSYQCLPEKDEEGNKLSILVTAFKPPIGLLLAEIENKKSKNIPFFWDSKDTVKLGTPIQFCGEMIDYDRHELLLSSRYLLLADHGRGLIGFFAMNDFSGSGLKMAAREPDFIMQVTGQGELIPGTCNPDRAEGNKFSLDMKSDTLLVWLKSGALGVFSLNGEVLRIAGKQFDGLSWAGLGETGDVSLLRSDGALFTFSNGEFQTMNKRFQLHDLPDIKGLFLWRERSEFVTVSYSKWLSSKWLKVTDEQQYRWDWRVWSGGNHYLSVDFLSPQRILTIDQTSGDRASVSFTDCISEKGIL